MYHSITFGTLGTKTESGASHSYISGKNTWDDWHLIPSSRPHVSPPAPNAKGVSVPGMNGNIDFSTLLTGYMTYGNRSGSWEFIVHHDYWNSWETTYSTIMGYLHGENMVCFLEDDPGYYYSGLFAVGDWKSEKDWSRITISYDVKPYKKEIQSSEEPWLWDPFCFEGGVIRSYGGITVAAHGTRSIQVIGCEEPIIPEIESNADLNLTVNSKTFHIVSGSHTYRGLKILSNATPTFTFSNSGNSVASVSVKFRGGEF